MENKNTFPFNSGILSNYPFPISFECLLLKDMLELEMELDTICEQLRTVMWFATRYLSIIVVSNYLHPNLPDLHLSNLGGSGRQMENDVREKRKMIFTSIRQVLETDKQNVAHGNHQGENQFPHESPREITRWIDIVEKIIDFWRLINYRPFMNEVMEWQQNYMQNARQLAYHYDVYRALDIYSHSELEDYYITGSRLTKTFLESISFVKNYPLVKALDSKPLDSHTQLGEEYFTWYYRPFMGCHIGEGREVYDTHMQYPDSELNNLSILDLCDPKNPNSLPLSPLSVFATYPVDKLNDIDGDQYHIAMIDDNSEKGLRYRLVFRDRNTPSFDVTLNKYLDSLQYLLTESLKPRMESLTSDAEWAERQKFAARYCRSNRNRIGEQKYRTEYYLTREIDTELQNFLSSEQSLMLIVGDAGVGKTNLLCNWSSILEKAEDAIVVFHDCRDYQGMNVDKLINQDFEKMLTMDLGERIDDYDPESLERVLSQLETTRPSRSPCYLILLLDALNEHKDADQLLQVLVTFLASAKAPKWIKVVLTCRREPWDKSLRYILPSTSKSFVYKFDELNEPIEINRFNEAEAEKAYTDIYHLKPEFSELPKSIQKLFEDPLMLGLANRVFGDSGVPRDLHQNKLLHAYLTSLIPEPGGDISKEQRFLTVLLKHMYEKKVTELPREDVIKHPDLKTAFQSERLLPNNPYIQLISDLLRDSGSTKPTITFRYERVFEFAIAKYILKPDAIDHKWSIDWFSENVDASKDFPSLSGAIRYLVIEYLTENEEHVQEIIRGFAGHSSYEMRKLIIDIMFVLADQPSYEKLIHQVLTDLIHPLKKSSDADSGTRYGEVAVSVARRLGWSDIFKLGAQSPYIAVRTASVFAMYYLWRRRKKDGIILMTDVSHLLVAEVKSSLLKLLIGYLRIRLFPRKNRGFNTLLQLLPMASSYFNLSIMVLSHCLREPETSKDLYKVWEPIFQAIPKRMERLLEPIISRNLAQTMIAIWGGASKSSQPSGDSHLKDAARAINIRNLKAFVDLELGHEYRKKAIHYLQECDPIKGRLTPIIDEVVDLAKIQDSIIHFVVQILFLTRGHPYQDDVLEICSKLCTTETPYDLYEGTTKMGVYLYSVNQPPITHMKFMEEAVLKIWKDNAKLFDLAGEHHLLNQIRYPIMYECSPVGYNRSRGQVEFVQKMRAQPWIGNEVDREVAIIQQLGEAGVFGHIAYNTHIIPILDTLQLWFPVIQTPTADLKSQYSGVSITEALATAFSKIQTIYPEEVERFLALAPAHLRQQIALEHDESAAAINFLGGQISLPWLFSRKTFRVAWVNALTWLAMECTSLEQGFQNVAAETFVFENLRKILLED